MLNGIDVSGHQPRDIMARVPADFVIVKTTGGTGFVAGYAATQLADAKRRGILRGVYHFARDGYAAATAQAEADHFLRHSEQYIRDGAIPVLDFEAEALAYGMNWAREFMRIVKQRTGVTPWFYTYENYVRTTASSHVTAREYPLWIASYGSNPVRSGYVRNPSRPNVSWPAGIVAFQYSSRGRLSGYSGDLDLNVFYGSRGDWGGGSSGGSSTQRDVIQDAITYINKTYPTRNWDQQCQRLMWNFVQHFTGLSDAQMVTYPTATAARNASNIESTDASKAPPGAMHWWRNPAEGHVAVDELGGGRSVFMTGTTAALGSGGQLLGNNWGRTSVASYTAARNNPYLGWSRSNGRNPSLVPYFEAAAQGGSTIPKGIEDMQLFDRLMMKRDGGEMDGLGVYIAPDGYVTGLTRDQWNALKDVAGIEPIMCRNPGHWSYFNSILKAARERNKVEVSDEQIQKLTDAVRETIEGSTVEVSAEAVAEMLQINVKK